MVAQPATISRPRLRGIVDLYLRKKLPRDIHPALKAVRDKLESNEEQPQIDTQENENCDIVQSRPTPTIIVENKNDNLSLDLEEIYKDAKTERELFKKALEQYESTTVGSKFKTDITSKKIHTWEEVLAEVNIASERYSDPAGFWGKIRKGLRRFGENSKAFEAWSSVLPSQSEYFSVLCGGLKLVFGAAARLEDLRSDIADALEEIPFRISCTRRAVAVFKPSKSLHECSAALYCSTIAALHHIVLWYQQKAIKKFGKSILKQDSYEKRLSSLLEDIRKKAKHFETSAQLCSYETLTSTHEMVQLYGEQNLDSHQQLLSEAKRSSDNLQTLKGDFASNASDMRKSIELQLSEFRQEMIEVVANFLGSHHRIDQTTQDLREPELPLRKTKSESRLIRGHSGVQAALVSAFDHESSVVRGDIEIGLGTVWKIPRADQDRIITAMKSLKLQQWIRDTVSSAIFINFNFQKHHFAASFLAAKLVDSVQTQTYGRATNIIALSFFCGLHSRPQDADHGVDGMLRSLVGQLLVAYPDFSIDIVDRVRNADLDRPRDLMEIFLQLVTQLPPQVMVFCILDSIDGFEQSEAYHQTAEIAVGKLMNLVRWTRNNGCIFKLLLTSPRNSHALYKQMPDQKDDIIWMPSKVPSQGGFTRLKWEATAGAALSDR